MLPSEKHSHTFFSFYFLSPSSFSCIHTNSRRPKAWKMKTEQLTSSFCASFLVRDIVVGQIRLGFERFGTKHWQIWLSSQTDQIHIQKSPNLMGQTQANSPHFSFRSQGGVPSKYTSRGRVRIQSNVDTCQSIRSLPTTASSRSLPLMPSPRISTAS